MGAGIGEIDIEEINRKHLESLETQEEKDAFLQELEEKRLERERSDLLAGRGSDDIRSRLFQEQEGRVKALESQVAEFEAMPGAPDRGEVIQQMLSGQLEDLKRRGRTSSVKTSGRGVDGAPMASNLLLGG
jgi:hypothetical protein